jgi:hypothetical protein
MPGKANSLTDWRTLAAGGEEKDETPWLWIGNNADDVRLVR